MQESRSSIAQGALYENTPSEARAAGSARIAGPWRMQPGARHRSMDC
jgi:hypothetical protein